MAIPTKCSNLLPPHPKISNFQKAYLRSRLDDLAGSMHAWLACTCLECWLDAPFTSHQTLAMEIQAKIRSHVSPFLYVLGKTLPRCDISCTSMLNYALKYAKIGEVKLVKSRLCSRSSTRPRRRDILNPCVPVKGLSFLLLIHNYQTSPKDISSTLFLSL